MAVGTAGLGVLYALPWWVIRRLARGRWRGSTRKWRIQSVIRSLTTLCVILVVASPGIADSSMIPKLWIVVVPLLIATAATVVDWRVLILAEVASANSKWFLVAMLYMNTIYPLFVAGGQVVWLKNNQHESDWLVAIVLVLLLFGLREAWQKVALPSVPRGS
ncbi:hypothetical protein L5I01_11670 [Gordonia sp. HY442]|uniref:hypothetical protein n=1 Tax=Gordonia zhenghanii TaxID=2911516 RepID=UPI001F2BACD0|nr:hypothetical protein [Gordonia zhenghanii]MCF8604015.1 hypothetical protein [Gordonia zhenghanii]